MKSLQLAVCFTLLLCARSADAQRVENAPSDAKGPSTIQSRTEGLERQPGFLPFYLDPKSNTILLEIDTWNAELLYVRSLATGLGSNPVGLDRGKMGAGKVVRFQRFGPKVLMIQRNLRYRANTANPLERRAVEESFAQSVLWAGKVVAQTGDAVLVDISSLLLSDPLASAGAHSVIQTLARNDQGKFSLNADRSAVYPEQCRAFPNNTEFEAMLTFTSSSPGPHVRETTPTASAVTLRQHHSFIKLPDRRYKPRAYDVRCPSNFIAFADYAAPLEAALQKRWIVRHRLEKKDPTATISAPVKPIVYYVDSGAPKQIQEALIEGARWWNAAFESAGFRDAFQVKVLPSNANPLDVRYNVIQWVHRSTRGWSYGNSVVDPRTGEILKGHVTLGSLRVRQDQLLINSLNAAPSNVSCACCGVGGVAEDTSLAAFDAKTSALDVALARIRQLSAHEVGHTLGFMHNFAASTYGDRASVMDYPAPRVKIRDEDQLDLSDAYGVGIGEWDKLSVQYAYTQFPRGVDESKALDTLLRDAGAKGMKFVSDADARPASAAQPFGNLWDNGADPLDELVHVMQVRGVALDRFDPKSLPAGVTTADIAQYFTPLYLHHRYQLQAAGKLVGGSEYEYGYAGGAESRRMVDADRQLKAVEVLLGTIHPSELTVSKRVTSSVSPRPYSTLRDREILPTTTGRIFDPLAAARVAVDLTLDELFQPQRLARLTVQARADARLEPITVVPSISRRIWAQSLAADGIESAQIGRVVREALLDKLIAIVDHPDASSEVRSAVLYAVEDLNAKAQSPARDKQEASFRRMLIRRASRVLERPYSPPPKPDRLTAPPGSPIGGR